MCANKYIYKDNCTAARKPDLLYDDHSKLRSWCEGDEDTGKKIKVNRNVEEVENCCEMGH